ncbi:hypothetical protein ACFWA1_36020 [Streptomyces sp. NPDC060005]|uniref:hypothetical protein n=1 Tax=Streptomyces sp. NPDC060005 TaxID=3347034 RepID=UPI0036736FDA
MTAYSAAQRARIAADHDRWATNREATAARLAAQGDDIGAGTFTRGAQECREVAAAARTSSEALEDVFDPL